MRWSTSKIPRPLNNILISDFWASAWMQMLKSTDVWPPLKQLYHFFTEEVLESLLNLANGFHDGASPSFWQNLMVSLFMLCYHFTMYWNPKSTHYMFSYMGSNVNWRFLQSAKKNDACISPRYLNKRKPPVLHRFMWKKRWFDTFWTHLVHAALISIA